MSDPATFADGGSFAANHPRPRPLAVAPSTEKQTNTVRLSLAIVACWRINHALFAFDSSFVAPEISAEIALLQPIADAHADAPASVFGHADPVGDDDYNKHLSGRRAQAIFGLLTRDVDLWEELHSKPFKGDVWGTRAIQTMLQTLGLYDGKIDGDFGSGTRTATGNFQEANGLPRTEKADQPTRAKLFRAYMDAICISPDKPFVLAKSRFLGGEADPLNKANFQGCSEFNPAFVFAKKHLQQLESQGKTKQRDLLNAPNRRVMLFFFRPGTKVSLDDWPCPRASEGVEGCKKQFWPDGDQRRATQEKERQYRTDRNTFACRFYDRFARVSPCEGIVKPELKIHLFDIHGKLVKNASFLATGEGFSIKDVAPDGIAVLKNVPIPETVNMKWSRPGKPEFEFELDVFVEVEGKSKEDAIRRRLSNMGYADPDLVTNVKAFQRATKKPITGVVADIEGDVILRHDRNEPPGS